MVLINLDGAPSITKSMDACRSYLSEFELNEATLRSLL